MAKKVAITDKVKIRGIRRRWLINSVGVVFLVLPWHWAPLPPPPGATITPPP